MRKPEFLFHEHFKPMQRSIILVHGVFEDSFFDLLASRKERIYVMEGRPSLKGGKTSCREFLKRNITPTLIADNMAGFLFAKDLVKEVWLAYHRANERGAMCFIGASILNIMAGMNAVPVYCYPAAGRQAALMGTGKDLTHFNGKRVAPPGTKTYVPLMEWLPGKCIEENYEPTPCSGD